MTARPLTLKEAKQKVAVFCARRERSPKEVVDKLYSWKLSSNEVQEILDQLLNEGFVDEQRFANAFCHDKFEFNSWGRQKIRMAILPHQLPSVVIQKALNRIDESAYFSRLCELAARKWDQVNEERFLTRKKKTIAFLASKGFEQELIWKAVERLDSNE